MSEHSFIFQVVSIWWAPCWLCCQVILPLISSGMLQIAVFFTWIITTLCVYKPKNLCFSLFLFYLFFSHRHTGIVCILCHFQPPFFFYSVYMTFPFLSTVLFKHVSNFFGLSCTYIHNVRLFKNSSFLPLLFLIRLCHLSFIYCRILPLEFDLNFIQFLICATRSMTTDPEVLDKNSFLVSRIEPRLSSNP